MSKNIKRAHMIAENNLNKHNVSRLAKAMGVIPCPSDDYDALYRLKRERESNILSSLVSNGDRSNGYILTLFNNMEFESSDGKKWRGDDLMFRVLVEGLFSKIDIDSPLDEIQKEINMSFDKGRFIKEIQRREA